MATITIGNNTGDDGGIVDNRLDSAAASVNYNQGAHTKGYAGPTTSREMREIQRFDLTDIPGGSTANSATLYLYDSNWANRTQDLTITIYKITDANGDWVEGTATDAPQAGSPCWAYKAYDASAPISWAGSAGLSTAGTDYINTSLGSAVFTDGVGGYRGITINSAGLAVLESWFGASNGNGWILIGTGSDGAWTEWDSRQGTDTQRPYLEIDYVAAGGGTTPRLLDGGLINGGILAGGRLVR